MHFLNFCSGCLRTNQTLNPNENVLIIRIHRICCFIYYVLFVLVTIYIYLHLCTFIYHVLLFIICLF